MNFEHTSVLLHETVDSLPVRKDGIYVDGTLGGGGHTEALLRRVDQSARVIGIDQDDAALRASAERLAPYQGQCTFVRENFRNILRILEDLEIEAIDGAMLDLGVSSHQLDEAERGFSYQADAPLDMRMDRRSQVTATGLLNTLDEAELAKIIFDYGEERFARKIAKRIVNAREDKPIETTGELVKLIKEAIPLAARETGPHPAKRTFQAIRIAVNDELGLLKDAIYDFVRVLRPGGRLAVITFHSLEDRIAKQAFQSLAAACTCPPEFPVCVCGGKAEGKIITRKPIQADSSELDRNPRARSAKLRVFEKNLRGVNMQQTARRYEADFYTASPAPKTRKVRKPNPAKKRRVRRQKMVKVTLLGVCFMMAFSVVLGYASIAELNQNLAHLNSEISEIQRANQQTQAQLEYELDLSKIETYAKDTLGMGRPASYQIVRLNMSKDDKSEVVGTKKTGAGSKIAGFFKSVLEYLQ